MDESVCYVEISGVSWMIGVGIFVGGEYIASVLDLVVPFPMWKMRPKRVKVFTSMLQPLIMLSKLSKSMAVSSTYSKLSAVNGVPAAETGEFCG